ncbi:GNAT family N-acetyltransferase [Streptomyces oceani]|uniref:GCN5 family acetyltransferase n=1 Tax=Streptomyces oceani TaxID=1075402 RepID=A0A1E7KKX5_9ACTN|nr:GNAT family N-acetyltransferase [Streptomyces oceani]OEV04471.1 GCN5 family acetyltransferase [Streptomyces oceani]
MTTLVIRPLVEHEARRLFTALPDPGLVGRALLGRPYDTLAAGGEYRPEWTWVALRAGEPVARAAYWARPEGDAPQLLDWFDHAPGERDAAVRLLRESAWPDVDYELILPPDWRAVPEVRAAAESRVEAAESAGYRPLVERFRYAWTPAHGLPDQPGRLTFRPEPDDKAVLDVLRRVTRGTLDAHAREDIRVGGLERAARTELDLLRGLPGPRDWWRLAYTTAGDLVGLHVPSRIVSGPCVAFVGVVPEHRGRGYAFDLLADCTRQLAEAGAESIAASTDLGNRPMAAAFARAGYPVTQHRYCMAAPGRSPDPAAG